MSKPGDEVFITTVEASAYINLSPSQIAKLTNQGAYGIYRRGKSGRNGRAIFIAVERMPADARARYYAAHPEHVPQTAITVRESDGVTVRSFAGAREEIKQRALDREIIVRAYNRGRDGLSDEQWVTRYKATHPGTKLSVDTLHRLRRRYAEFGLDGLVDGNDGSARRDRSVIPEAVAKFAIGHYTTSEEPNAAESIRDARIWAETQGIEFNASDKAFRYLLARIPDVILRATRDHQDDDSKVIATLRRDYNFPALTIVQADHHLSDMFVRCDVGSITRVVGDRLVTVAIPGICEGECQHGHRVWLTVFIDVASRAVLSWVASLTYPNAETILLAFRRLVERFGLPNAVYIDNGKDFQSAFGRAIRAGSALALNEDYLNNLMAALRIRVIFAIPYRARSKGIERLFRTWVEQIWKGTPSYVGELGKRRDRVKALYSTPAELPSYAEFCERLGVKVDLYNMTEGHRGQGMNGRSPLKVLAETRIDPRTPEPQGWAYAFFLWFGRQVGTAGALEVDGARYRLPVETYVQLPRRTFVQVLIDPDDMRTAIVLTGCPHTKAGVSRSTVVRCGCRGKGELLCAAPMWGLSTFDSEDPITVASHRLLNAWNRDLKQKLRVNKTSATARAVQEFKTNRLALYAAMRDRLVAANQELIAQATGSKIAATTVLLPQSTIARQLGAYRSLTQKDGLTPEQHQLADAASDRRRLLSPPTQLHAVEPTQSIDADIMRERELRGFCLFDTECPNARKRDSEFCHQHENRGD